MGKSKKEMDRKFTRNIPRFQLTDKETNTECVFLQPHGKARVSAAAAASPSGPGMQLKLRGQWVRWGTATKGTP